MRKATIAIPLKYFRNFWRAFEMPLINCKVELKLKWTKYYVFSAAGKDNTNDNPNNYYFYYQRHKIICSCCNFVSARDNPKLSKLLSKGFEGSIYWNEYKTKRENKNTPNEYRYFLEPDLVGVNRLFELAYLKRNNDIQPLKTQRYYLEKGIIVYYNVIVNGKKCLWPTHWFKYKTIWWN